MDYQSFGRTNLCGEFKVFAFWVDGPYLTLADTAGGDYHLAAGSEAIDAGTAEDAPDHDIDGAVRPQGAAHDVGAYESPAN